MKIILLATDAYGGHGGIALFNRNLIAALAAAHEVVVVPRVVRREPGELPSGVQFVQEAARGDLGYARTIARLTRSAPDLVICGHINLLPAACALAGHPVLIAHGIDAWKPTPRALANRLVHRCRALIAVSALTRDRLLAWSGFRGPAEVLPNAVSLAEYGIRPKRADLVARYGLQGRRVILTVGRLASTERYKGVDEVLDVLGMLPSDVTYLVGGDGDDTPRLTARARTLGLEGRVVFTGAFAEQDKADLYNLADVYAMPSRGEGFGFVFLEAMASGVPVIASKHDGGREALRDGSLGWLVDPASPDELRAAIVEVLTHGSRRIPEGLQHFTIANFRSRVSAILTRLAAEPSESIQRRSRA